MKTEKILSLLGFATKAGKLSFGFDMTSQAIKKKKCFLIVNACDVSAKTLKEIDYKALESGIKRITLEGVDIKALSAAVGKSCGIISVNEKGFADACETAFNEGGNANDK